ncbi:hypothetical protein BRADI_5g17080v3 [Brachypodium distachyon]|uniref:B box-type domain-containing protein n=1 Tax=Brachypodium distachyon TaxID=15368 RepID=A0A0Q3P4V8_BRADI|nr:hypothetical protein BRADI_5g17080v3 [Brachypodium distachyon]
MKAALCDACDRRVHRANKLAGKHRRLSLLHPSASPSSSAQKPPPLCDICQEKRGFLFCKEDRAILCRECDVQVHTASELTRRHGRFLLTGVRVSSAPADSPAPSEEEPEDEEEENSCSGGSGSASATASASASDGSSISEYLTKTLPGWHVEDFLLDDAAAAASAAAVYLDKPYQGVQAARTGGVQLQEASYTAWAGREQRIGGVPVAAGERARRELWVPQMSAAGAGAEWTGSSKRPRAPPPYSYW